MARKDLLVHDIEDWHDRARQFLSLSESHSDLIALAQEYPKPEEVTSSNRLHTDIAGVQLKNPILVGAGWDKTGVTVKSMAKIGFAGVEVGSIQNYPQYGNPRPRHFELSRGVTINWYGFNSPGAQAVAQNLKLYQKSKLVIGINIGRNKEIPDIATLHMMATVAERLYSYATYFVINVSSPNTLGLKKLQRKEPLGNIIKAVKDVVSARGGKPPIFVKISPDLKFSEIDDVINLVLKYKIHGIVAANTTSSQRIKANYGPEWRNVLGGLSGNNAEYRNKTTKIISHIYKQSSNKFTIIGAGGVNDGKSALEKLLAGASAVQIVTAIKYEGIGIVNKINRELLEWMDKNQVKNITDIIGAGTKLLT